MCLLPMLKWNCTTGGGAVAQCSWSNCHNISTKTCCVFIVHVSRLDARFSFHFKWCDSSSICIDFWSIHGASLHPCCRWRCAAVIYYSNNTIIFLTSVCLLFPMNECYPDTKLKKPQQPNRPKTVAMVPTGGHIPPVGDLCYKVSSSCFLYITDFCIVFLVWKKTRKSQAGGHWTVTELYLSPSPLVVVKLCDTQLWLSRATCWETKPFQWITTMN